MYIKFSRFRFDVLLRDSKSKLQDSKSKLLDSKTKLQDSKTKLLNSKSKLNREILIYIPKYFKTSLL